MPKILRKFAQCIFYPTHLFPCCSSNIGDEGEVQTSHHVKSLIDHTKSKVKKPFSVSSSEKILSSTQNKTSTNTETAENDSVSTKTEPQNPITPQKDPEVSPEKDIQASTPDSPSVLSTAKNSIDSLTSENWKEYLESTFDKLTDTKVISLTSNVCPTPLDKPQEPTKRTKFLSQIPLKKNKQPNAHQEQDPTDSKKPLPKIPARSLSLTHKPSIPTRSCSLTYSSRRGGTRNASIHSQLFFSPRTTDNRVSSIFSSATQNRSIYEADDEGSRGSQVTSMFSDIPFDEFVMRQELLDDFKSNENVSVMSIPNESFHDLVDESRRFASIWQARINGGKDSDADSMDTSYTAKADDETSTVSSFEDSTSEASDATSSDRRASVNESYVQYGIRWCRQEAPHEELFQRYEELKRTNEKLRHNNQYLILALKQSHEQAFMRSVMGCEPLDRPKGRVLSVLSAQKHLASRRLNDQRN